MIINAANTPLNQQPQGTVPDVSGALTDWFQTMTFTIVTKTPTAFQAVETGTQYTFQGVMQPFRPRDLQLKPEGERSWGWQWLHAEPGVILNVDDVVIYQGTQYRVMGKNDCSLYGFIEYALAEDWTGSGPA